MSAKTNVKDQVTHAAKPAYVTVTAIMAEKFPLDIVFANELPDTYEAPDELVQGLLTVGGGSVLYGDSNCGKTFFAIDLACAVARGADWMGRRTEQGLVVYLAAESPQSVRSRVQAYQKHHAVEISDFAIVQNSINLFASDTDTEAIIKAVKMIEAQRKQKVRLIIGDTLARMSAGANENAGQDMGLVIDRFDRIRRECCAHFMLIHHSGKSAAAGARGWSGVRAAVDVEIEVNDSATGRYAEVTKDRDLGSKGERIGFGLEAIEAGRSKWGKSVTTCIVVPAAAAPGRKGPKPGTIAGRIMAFLHGKDTGADRTDISANLPHPSSSVDREIRALVNKGLLHEEGTVFSIVKSPA